MSADSLALVDTNVLVYAVDDGAPQHSAAKAFYDRAVAGDVALCVSPQILFEYVSVVTNAKRVMVPSTADEAWADVEAFVAAFQVIVPAPGYLDRVRAIAKNLRIGGAHVFDLVHAQTALDNGVSEVYTYDQGFPVLPGIVIKTP